MRHYRKRAAQSADKKAPNVSEGRQSAEYLLSRLTPSPEPSPPALRLEQDEDTYVSGTVFASNLLELYRSTDIAKAGERNELAEGKSSDDGFEGSEDGSRGISACFEESTSHLVTIIDSSEKECGRVGDNEDDDLIAACSLVEGLQTSEGTRSAVVVDTNGRLAAGASSLEQALSQEEAESLTVEPTGDISTTAWQHTKRAETSSEEQGHHKRESVKGELDSKLPDAYGGQALRADQVECERRAAAGGEAPFWCKDGDNARAVAAVRRRSLLAGATAVAGVGLAAVACISPWNVHVASICIVAGVCLCTLGWVSSTFKSPLLLALHSVLLFCLLLTCAVSIVLNFHWAVQSFRALRHAYFDDCFALERASPAGPRKTHVTVSSVSPTPTRAPPPEVQVTVAATKTAHGLANDNTMLVPASLASTAASSRLPTAVGAHEAEVDEKTHTGTAVDQPHLFFPLRHPLNTATATLWPTQLQQRSPRADHLAHGNPQGSSGCSHNLQGSSSFSRRKQQWMEGSTTEGIETDGVKVDASVNCFGGSRKTSSLNSLNINTVHSPQTPLRSGPVVKTVGQSSLPVNSPTFPHWQSVSDAAELHPPEGEQMKQADGRRITARKGRGDDVIKQSLQEKQPSPSPVNLIAKDGRDGDESTHALREQLHPKENQVSVQPRDHTPNDYTSKDLFILARDVSSLEGIAAGLQNRQSVASSNTSANFTGVSSITLPSGTSGSSGELTLLNEIYQSTDTDALDARRYQVALQQPNLFAGTSGGQSVIQSFLSAVPSAASETADDPTDGSQETNWRLQDGIVNPEPAHCDNVPDGLLRYVHSTRRQLETYGLLCAFSRYDLWGLFNRWSVDCETECGFKFLATKRYMWSKGFAGNSAGAPASAGRAGYVPRLRVSSPDEIQKPTWRPPPSGRRLEKSELPPNSSVATVSSRMANNPPLEYLQWHAALPPATQKACLEGALNVACSVVKSHYLMLLPPLAVLLLLISFILLGIGIAALRSTIRLRCLAATKR